MNRITPEMVVEAFKETGLKPEQGVTLFDGCACGLGAIYAQKFGVKEEWTDEVFDAFRKDLYPLYICGFALGFDGENCDTSGMDEHEKAGYEDGQAAWQAVVNAGLVEVDE